VTIGVALTQEIPKCKLLNQGVLILCPILEKTGLEIDDNKLVIDNRNWWLEIVSVRFSSKVISTASFGEASSLFGEACYYTKLYETLLQLTVG
jgi:hypothetical protein